MEIRKPLSGDIPIVESLTSRFEYLTLRKSTEGEQKKKSGNSVPWKAPRQRDFESSAPAAAAAAATTIFAPNGETIFGEQAALFVCETE